jgi:hypothetical protein
MARFQLTQAVHVGDKRFRAGSAVADTQGNALPGDKVWVGLNSATMIEGMTPLDASATTMKAASRFASVAPRLWITGCESVDA